MNERIWRMLVKEFIQVLRDPKTRFVLFITPTLQVLLFGYAATTDVEHIATAIYDLDHSVTSRDLIARFQESGYFDLVQVIDRESRIAELLNGDEIRAVIRINKGFDEDLRAGRTAALQVIVDGTDSNTAGVVLDYAGKIAGEFSWEILTDRFAKRQRNARIPGWIEFQRRAWYNENLESRVYYVPGVIAMVVTMITIILTSMAVVREKEVGTIEQIMVSPIRPHEFILGKSLPFALIGLGDMCLVTFIAVWWFEVPFRGNLGFLAFATAVYLMTTLGLGLLISTISQTQQQALMSMMFFYFPLSLLSGFAYPIANMPTWVQWLTYLNPLRYFMTVLRGVFLKGVGPSVLWPEVLAMFLLGASTLWLAVRRFHKTIA